MVTRFLRKYDLLLLAALLIACSAFGQEKIKLAAPIQVDKGADEFAISLVILDWKDAGGVRIDYSEVDAKGAFVPGGKRIEVNLRGHEALKLMWQIETGDFSKISLKAKIAARLQEQGKLATGTVSGAPIEPTTTTTITIKTTTTTTLAAFVGM